MSRYDPPDPLCDHRRRGIVTSHPGGGVPPRGEAHAATSVCARSACIEDAQEWVRAVTHREGIHVPDQP